MLWSEWLGIIFSLIGMGLFLFSLIIVRKILSLFPKAKMRKDWKLIAILIGIFTVGYIVNIIAILLSLADVLVVMTAFVYLFGAIFVLIVIQLSYRTYKLILESAEE
jgi:hypothetical protein